MTTDTNTEDLDALYPYDPNDPDPEETTRMRGYPELIGMTFGQVLAAATAKPEGGGEEAQPGKTKAKTAKPKRFTEGFDLPVKEERDVTLRAARIALVVTKVVDGEGKLVENAVVTVMVCDRTK